MATLIEPQTRAYLPPRTPPVRALHPKQIELLAFISAFITAHGYPPSVRECASAIEITSMGHVHYHLLRLETLGYITRDSHVSRSIRIIRTVAQPLEGTES